MSDKIREAFSRIHAKIIDGNIASAFSIFKEGYEAGAALAQQPAPEVPEDLRARCAEILAWQKTGVLKGDALRGYARAQWYADEHNSLQMAEVDTARQAYAFLVAAPPSSAQEPVDANAMAAQLAPMITEWVDGGLSMGLDWRLGLTSVIARRIRRLTATHAAEQPTRYKCPGCGAATEPPAAGSAQVRCGACGNASAATAACAAAEQQECGCCGQTGPCDVDCDCAEQPDAVKVPRELLRMAWRLIPGAEGMSEEQQAEHAAWHVAVSALLGKEGEA